MAENSNCSLQWKGYLEHYMEAFSTVLEEECMVDVTLRVEGVKFHAHRIVLCMSSPYFQKILSAAEEDYPVIILSEMKASDIRAILDFVYHGELYLTSKELISVLKTAEELQILGLTEVNTNFSLLNGGDDDVVAHVDVEMEHMVETEEEACVSSEREPDSVNEVSLTENEMYDMVKKKRKKRDVIKKEYSEESLKAALDDLRAGKTLVETSHKHKIPRSTLYMRARSLNVPMTFTRHGHSGENVQAAVKAVREGASLKQASTMYKIPKTVLWRRVRKTAGAFALSHRNRNKIHTYCSDKKQEAVEALARGENLTLVSQIYQIPKTTLFREKARLVESGRLPWSSWRQRNQDSSKSKQQRLSEAVKACKEGRMSQAVASHTFQVPKTTIWRRLQKITQCEKSNNVPEPGDKEITIETDPVQEQQNYTFPDVNTTIPVTYIDDPDFPDAPLIILTTGDGNNEITLQEGESLLLRNNAQDSSNSNTVKLEDET